MIGKNYAYMSLTLYIDQSPAQKKRVVDAVLQMIEDSLKRERRFVMPLKGKGKGKKKGKGKGKKRGKR